MLPTSLGFQSPTSRVVHCNIHDGSVALAPRVGNAFMLSWCCDCSPTTVRTPRSHFSAADRCRPREALVECPSRVPPMAGLRPGGPLTVRDGCFHVPDGLARVASMSRRQLAKAEPIFLTIRWQLVKQEDGTVVAVQARLCLPHRKKIALKYPSAQGCGQPGDSCDLCEGRRPRRL